MAFERRILTALMVLILTVLGAVLLMPFYVTIESKQCANPVTERIGSVPLWDSCGTERKKEAVNDD